MNQSKPKRGGDWERKPHRGSWISGIRQRPAFAIRRGATRAERRVSTYGPSVAALRSWGGAVIEGEGRGGEEGKVHAPGGWSGLDSLDDGWAMVGRRRTRRLLFGRLLRTRHICFGKKKSFHTLNYENQP